MKSMLSFVQSQKSGLRLRPYRYILLPFVLLTVCLGPSAQAQVEPSADQGGIKLSAGVEASAYQLGYGQLKVAGGTAFVDADTLRHFGAEGEFSMLKYHLKAHQNVGENAKNYLAGLRYYRDYGRFQPYAKALAGISQFNFPSETFSKETGLLVAGGGGVDYHLTNRIRWRADFEYQVWPHFEYQSFPQPVYSTMSSYGVSTGFRIKIH
jgi:hypothetical protein